MNPLITIVAIALGVIIIAVFIALQAKYYLAHGAFEAALDEARMSPGTWRKDDGVFAYEVTHTASGFRLVVYHSDIDKKPRLLNTDHPRSTTMEALLETRYYGVTGHQMLCIQAAKLNWAQIAARMAPRRLQSLRLRG